MLMRVLLVAGILLVFLGLVLGMGDTTAGSVKSPVSRFLMIGGVSLIGVWFGVRFFGDMTRADPEAELEARRKERELEKAEQRKKRNKEGGVES